MILYRSPEDVTDALASLGNPSGLDEVTVWLYATSLAGLLNGSMDEVSFDGVVVRRVDA